MPLVQNIGLILYLFLPFLVASFTIYPSRTIIGSKALIQRQRLTITQTFMSSDKTKPSRGDIVSITYSLKADDDFVPETLFDQGTVQFVLGFGNYLPGLHEAVSDLIVGESIKGLTLDAGYGKKNPNLIAEASYESSGISKEDIKIGQELYLANGMKCRVVSMNDKGFTIDANHPLAGASYSADIKLNEIKTPPVKEQYEYHPHKIVGKSDFDVMTIALGCFWGGELAYQRVPGVVGTSVGFTQGKTENPTYEEVCSGTTGHTEAIQVVYNPKQVSFEKLVRIGMERLGDSKYLLNQVGNDKGTQYRHGVYFHNDEQRGVAETVIKSYGEKCVTECLEAKPYYMAEEYHQQYLLKGGQPANKNNKQIIRCYG